MAVESEYGFKGDLRDPLPFKSRVAPRNPQTVVPISSIMLPHVQARNTDFGSGGGPSATSLVERALIERSGGG